MKRMLLIILTVPALAAWAAAAGIVNNSTVSVTSEDSISFLFYNLDSLGQNIGGLDTTWVLVLGPAGDSVFSEIVPGASGRVRLHVAAGDTLYGWSALVADVDGGGRPGQYSVGITAGSDRSGAWLRTPIREAFQLVEWELNAIGDSTGAAARYASLTIDSLTKALQSAYALMDSVTAVLDTLQAGFGSQAIHGVNIAAISDDSAAADAFESILDGTGGGRLALGGIDIFALAGPAVRIAGNDTGITVRGTGTGPGIYVAGSGDGVTIEAASGYHDVVADIHGSIDSVLMPPDSVSLYDEEKKFLAGLAADSVLVDSSSYQGDAANIDSAAVARWVWNTPHENHQAAGTFGGYLDAEISGLGSGSGLYSCSIMVYDSAAARPIPYAAVSVRSVSESALIAVGRTNSDGLATFSLDAGDFLVLALATGYVFYGGDTVSVAGEKTDTLYGCFFNPGTPSSPSLCRVFGFLYDIQGLPLEQVTVSAALPAGVTRSGSMVVSPLMVSTVTDSAGYFALDLIPSEDLDPANSVYEITVGSQQGAILRKRLLIPGEPSWQIIW